MYKSIVALLAVTVGCLGNPAHAGAVPGVSDQAMISCMKAFMSGKMQFPKPMSFDYCRASLTALNNGYSFDEAVKYGLNFAIQRHGMPGSIVPSMINSTNPFASSTFQWNDPGSIYD